MKPVAFDYIRAGELGEAIEALGEYGPDAAVLAGGMSLGPMLNMRLVRPAVVVDIGRISELRQITSGAGEVRIGATANQANVMQDGMVAEAVPLLTLALPHVGHYQTRSRGTVGGSIAHADPSAEIPLCLLVLGGEVELTSSRGRRLVPAVDFFDGILATARKPDELITASIWRKRLPGNGYAFAEFAQRHGDFAVASAACGAELNDDGTIHKLQLGLGGVEDRPIVVETPGVAGEVVSAGLIAEIAGDVSRAVDPLEDMTASADHRRALADTLVGQVLREALDKADAEAAP